MENTMQELVSKLVNDIELRKENLLLDRINVVSSNSFCPEKEADRRFKSVLHESHPDRDSYYYDNGSISGVHLVTFYKPKDFNTVNFDMEFKSNFNLNYTFDAP